MNYKWLQAQDIVEKGDECKLLGMPDDDPVFRWRPITNEMYFGKTLAYLIKIAGNYQVRRIVEESIVL